MNIKLNQVIQDLTERLERKSLRRYRMANETQKYWPDIGDWRIKTLEETLIKSLEGNWREEQVFNLRLAYKHYFLTRLSLSI